MKISQVFNSLKPQTAFHGYLVIVLIALIYHALILTQVVDYKNAWGGQLASLEQMYVFETFSITLQILFTVIIFLKLRAKPETFVYKATRILVYTISVIFLLNTIGNIFAVEMFERLVFSPLTLITSILTFRIALASGSETS